jgi:hypothetical protein
VAGIKRFSLCVVAVGLELATGKTNLPNGVFEDHQSGDWRSRVSPSTSRNLDQLNSQKISSFKQGLLPTADRNWIARL